jgi:hypothetical protein
MSSPTSYLAQHAWSCKSCSTSNWNDRTTCRACSSPKKSSGPPWSNGGTSTPGGKRTPKGTPQTLTPPINTKSTTSSAAEADAAEPVTPQQLKGQLKELQTARTALAGPLNTSAAAVALDEHIFAINAKLNGLKPVGERLDGLRGVIGRCQKRIQDAQDARKAAADAFAKETADLQRYQAELRELETSVQAPFSNAQPPEWLASSLHLLIESLQKGGDVSRDGMVQALRGVLIPPVPSTFDLTTEDDMNDDEEFVTPTMPPPASFGGTSSGQPPGRMRMNTKTMVETTPMVGMPGSRYQTPQLGRRAQESPMLSPLQSGTATPVPQ